MTPADLIAFEDRIAARYNAGAIRAPIHLSGGNEAQLIDYFNRSVDPARDWVFSTWRSHYHALLFGVLPVDLEDRIIASRSITLTFPRFVTSAIVAGHVPMAVGVALAMKRSDPRSLLVSDERPAHVHCFVGDMAARTGLFDEARRYATYNDLPITFIIEDNGVSVRTPTLAAWWPGAPDRSSFDPSLGFDHKDKTAWYSYELTRPHSGTGEFIRW